MTEGAREVVAAYFQRWQELVAGYPREPGGPPAVTPGGGSAADLFTVDPQRKLVTLRAYPEGKTAHADAALLLLYGFHQSFGEAGRAVGVTRLKAALTASGHPDARIDRTLERYRDAGMVKKRGRRIGSIYQLTPSGSQRAATLAAALRRNAAPSS